MFKLPAFSARPTTWARNARPVLERIAFVFYLATFIGTCGLIGLGLIFALLLEEVRPLCVGLAGGAFVRLFQQHGYRAWRFAQWEDSLMPSDAHVDAMGDPVRADRAMELEGLLREIESGSSEVWAVQDLRHRAKALLNAEPGLRDSYAQELADHPELG